MQVEASNSAVSAIQLYGNTHSGWFAPACIAILLIGCGSQEFDPHSANDEDVQLALRGASRALAREGLYEGLADDLNAYGWSLAFRGLDEPLGCPEGTGGCTRFDPSGYVSMRLRVGNGLYAECPRMPSTFIHELFHVALFFQTGDSDNGHVNSNWHFVNTTLTLEQICNSKEN